MKEKMFEKKQFPSLQSLAMDIAAKNFNLYPELAGISERTRQIIIEKSIQSGKKETNNLLISAPNIEQEKYWKARCEKQKDRLFPIKLQDHGLSWKVAYIEKYIEKELQRLESYEQRKKELLQIFRIVNPWVFNLEVKINAADLKLDEICKYLTNIVNFKVKCSQMKNTDYKKKIVGLRFTEARDISQILRTTQSMLSINLSGNLIDDDLFKTICPGLMLNTTLVQLNLSYNNIGDQGARKLAKFLLKNKVLTDLNLASNAIGYDGSRYISQAMKLNTAIDILNLKLNSIDDKGGAKFFKDLVFNTNIKHLDMEANLFSSMTARKLSLYLQSPNPLKQLHIGSNNFNPDQLNIIADSIPQKVCREYFVKSKYTIIKLGE